MARTTPAQKPRGCARKTSMGRPLTKLHRFPECPRPTVLLELQYPHQVPLHPRRAKRMSPQGFVAKRGAKAKPKSAQTRTLVSVFWYYSTAMFGLSNTTL